MKVEVITLNEERNVTLTAYLQDVGGEFGFGERPAMLVLPGGGYAMCSDREADPVAIAYLQAGYQAFVLRYTVGKDCVWPQPLEDYEQAMALIEENTDKWHIAKGKTAVAGFSAGGHLAACAATIAEHRPAAAVLVYPAILSDILDLCKPNLPQPHQFVSMDTCPCFLAAARDDRVVNIKNAILMELALAEKNIPFESHIYSYGGHGFSTAEDWINTNSVSERVPHWMPDSIGWLGENMGQFTHTGMTEPNIAVSLNADNAPVLSVGCTLNHIRRQGEETQSLLASLYAGIHAVADERGFSVEGLMAAVGNTTIRELLETLQIPAETILELDQALHKIVNRL